MIFVLVICAFRESERVPCRVDGWELSVCECDVCAVGCSQWLLSTWGFAEPMLRGSGSAGGWVWLTAWCCAQCASAGFSSHTCSRSRSGAILWKMAKWELKWLQFGMSLGLRTSSIGDTCKKWRFEWKCNLGINQISVQTLVPEVGDSPRSPKTTLRACQEHGVLWRSGSLSCSVGATG